MPDLNMDDPFGFHKSIENGEFKLQGVGKLYGQDEETPIDGLEYQFELFICIKDRARAEIHFIPIDRNSSGWSGVFGALRPFAFLLRLEGRTNGRMLRVFDICCLREFSLVRGRRNESLDEFWANFFRLELGEKKRKYSSVLVWVPNLAFTGEPAIGVSTFSFPSLVGGLEIELSRLANYEGILEHLKRIGGSEITSICRLVFGTPQTFEGIYELYKKLCLLFSFVEGRWISPLAYWFQDADNMLSISLDLRVRYGMEEQLWCDFTFNSHLKAVIEDIFPKYLKMSERNQSIVESAIFRYTAAITAYYFEGQVMFLARAYEGYLDALLGDSGNYSFDRGALKSTLKKFFEGQQGEDAELILEKLDGKLNDFVRKPFKDRLKMLLKEQDIAYDEKLVGRFVKLRNTIIHSKEVLKGNGNQRGAFRYMLRHFEILTLKRLGYEGRFRDHFEDYRTIPFSQMLEELKLKPEEG